MDFEAKAREVCEAMDAPMRRMGVVTTAHYDAGIPLIADALRAAALDEESREAARADLGRLLAELKRAARRPPLTDAADVEAIDQAISAAVLNPATSETYGSSALRPLYGVWRTQRALLERLLWLLGLSGGERRFVAALADDVADFDTAQVYADWLLDQGRTADGARVRRLVPQDGDVVVVRHPPGPVHEAHCATVQQMVDALAVRGVRVWAATMSDDMSLETAPPDAMRAAGWVRVEDVASRLADLAGDLEARRDGRVDRAIALHFDDLFGPPAPEAPP